MLKVTRLADYAVSIIYAFSGSEKEILSSQDIIEKTKKTAGKSNVYAVLFSILDKVSLIRKKRIIIYYPLFLNLID